MYPKQYHCLPSVPARKKSERYPRKSDYPTQLFVRVCVNERTRRLMRAGAAVVSTVCARTRQLIQLASCARRDQSIFGLRSFPSTSKIRDPNLGSPSQITRLSSLPSLALPITGLTKDGHRTKWPLPLPPPTPFTLIASSVVSIRTVYHLKVAHSLCRHRDTNTTTPVFKRPLYSV